ncbi:MAG TPA: citrate/2-methylcitrate synthase [Ktedonobacterales bacterium]|nr:citrate/2-methylcitrate synthase [Ktedonobacterales bacterium]
MSGKGLEGVIAATTTLSLVDGNAGRLIYRGYEIGDLAARASFEEVAYLLWQGRLPNQHELAELRAQMAAQRALPEKVIEVIKTHGVDADPMALLRTAVSALGSTGDFAGAPSVAQAMSITAKIPTILATFHRYRVGLPSLSPRADLSHTAHYLYLLTGEEPTASQVRALDAYLVLTADHGMNASTFTARVIASTLSDLISSITGAIGALKGPLHGGAPSKVADMLDAIGTEAQAEPWLRAELERGARIMGFGHRVYKTEDPRAVALRTLAGELADKQDAAWLALAHHVEDVTLRLLDEYKPGRKLYTYVEFSAAAVLRGVGLPRDLYTPTFALSRVAGWTAHVLEQLSDNRLIRPAAEYVGPRDLSYPTLVTR